MDSGRVDREGAEATSRAWYDGRLEGEDNGTEEGKFMAKCSRSGFGQEPWWSATVGVEKYATHRY